MLNWVFPSIARQKKRSNSRENGLSETSKAAVDYEPVGKRSMEMAWKRRPQQKDGIQHHKVMMTAPLEKNRCFIC